MGCGKSTAKASGAPAAARDTAAGPNLLNAEMFAVSDKVRVRDSVDEEWRTGTVTAISPLKVLPDGWHISNAWKVVEPFGDKVSDEVKTAAAEAAKADMEQEEAQVVEKNAAAPKGGCWCA
jgi:hypothetical protein